MGQDGPASLVTDQFANKILKCYYRLVRAKMEPQERYDNMFFLTPTGTPYKQVYRRISAELKKHD